jgi:DNA-binding response OmpR family regulator
MPCAVSASAESPQGGQETIELGPLRIMPDEQLVRVTGRTLMLSIRELHLLVELGRRVDRIVSREELFRLAWGGRCVRVMGPSTSHRLAPERVRTEAASDPSQSRDRPFTGR